MASATTVVYESGFQYTLSVVPLFILMGNFVTRAGMSQELFRAAYAFIGHLRGGLGYVVILAAVLMASHAEKTGMVNGSTSELVNKATGRACAPASSRKAAA